MCLYVCEADGVSAQPKFMDSTLEAMCKPRPPLSICVVGTPVALCKHCPRTSIVGGGALCHSTTAAVEDPDTSVYHVTTASIAHDGGLEDIPLTSNSTPPTNWNKAPTTL